MTDLFFSFFPMFGSFQANYDSQEPWSQLKTSEMIEFSVLIIHLMFEISTLSLSQVLAPVCKLL